MSLLNRFHIRHATAADAETCQRIARQFRHELPFVMLPTLRAAASKRELHVAVLDGAIVGFVNWHAATRGANKGCNVVYDLAVDKDCHAQGIGRALLYSVPAPIRLKVTADNERANRFYANAGMQLAGSEAGKKRALNIYELRLLSVLVAGNNRRFPEVARDSGMAYGTRHDMTPRDWPFMVDIHWRDYDWTDYMHKVSQWRPVQAMVADYERPSQRRTLYKQIRDLKAAGVLRVLVCPKFIGAVAHIPRWCVIAVSIPSKYAGFVPPLDELKGRRLHLLGGSPVAQREWLLRLNAGATVISLDGNSHADMAKHGKFWNGAWTLDNRTLDYYDLCKLSGRNIHNEMQVSARFQQLPLWRAA